VAVPYDAEGAIAPVNVVTLAIPSRYREFAGFGNLTWHITERFDVSGGLRYAKNKQRFEQIGSGLLIGSQPEVRSTDDVVTYLANARYRFSKNATLYVRYATGYRPGGPNYVVNDPLTGDPLAPATFKSDSLQSFEAGFKAETADRSFGIDLAGYYIDWKDIQISTAAGGVSVIANAGGAHVTGAELTLTARPSSTITATGAFAWQRARLADDDIDLGAVKGDRLPNVPKYTVTMNLDYRAPATSTMRPSAGATVRFVSDRSASFDGSAGFPQYQLPDYVAVDLRAGATFGPVEAQVFVRNLFDTRGQLSAATVLSILGGPAQVSMMQPRTVGISATTRF
jgi:outer membrane receptor protein involved in Fe transport